MLSAITLRPVDRENWREALTLSVGPEQQRFVADFSPIAAIALAKAYVRPDGLEWTPYGIYAGERMVGFFVLAGMEHPGVSWLYHFFIDQRVQGLGYGKAALEALLDKLRAQRPPCCSLKLTVHPENVQARQFYERVGFESTWEDRFGEPIYALDLV